MNIQNEKAVKIFRKDNEFGTSYSASLTRKNQNGGFENGYMPIRFKKGIELADRTDIYLKDAFLTFYIKDKRTIPYIMCMSYEIAGKKEKNPYEEFGTEIQINDSDLPF